MAPTCGHVFCKGCILQHCADSAATCPLCRASLRRKDERLPPDAYFPSTAYDSTLQLLVAKWPEILALSAACDAARKVQTLGESGDVSLAAERLMRLLRGATSKATMHASASRGCSSSSLPPLLRRGRSSLCAGRGRTQPPR